MHRLWILLAVVLAAACPARAAEVEENETLVMRLIFEDCLGYVRHGRTPFAGLPTRPATPAAIEQLSRGMPGRDKAIELISPRYIANWGPDGRQRFCMMYVVSSADQDGLPPRLGVPVNGFLGRVTARAAAEGLTETEAEDPFSPLRVSEWSVPDVGRPQGVPRPVHFVLLAGTSPDARGIVDVGYIVMAEPP